MLKFALLALLAVAQVYAAHPLSNLPAPGLVTVGSFFPDQPNKHFVAGKPVKCVLGIHNDAAVAYNVTAIVGSLNSPGDFKLYIQNFTENVFHADLAPGAEISLEYRFQPDARIEPRDFVVALTVLYHDNKGKYFSSTFFNSTVEIVEEKKMIDWELIQLTCILAVGLAGFVYIVYSYVEPHLAQFGIKKRKGSRKETSKPDDADEWVKGSHYDNLKKKKAAAKKLCYRH
ncbi:hypothetical protein FOA52_014761 [Chlamydomonas sp. UWO 241]|nr:hypothetical protein FOA52_014761 [Chlamydomonas sp. UWO 241]